ncbi:MAG TPA: HDOD domain-containing protein [Lachnospiraceae bacterium]|nr:HDOD domain-containing protein [Lachnospiraceae bacterium]
MLTKEKVYELIENSNLLPHLPEKTQEIFRVLNMPTLMGMDDLSSKVEEDKELSDLILHHLNSNCFNLRREISDIKEAVIFLGMDFVRNFLIFFIAQRFFLSIGTRKSVIFNMKKYWKHVMATSVAADMISERLGIQDKYRLFSYGLNHDIGILVMNTCLPGELDEITTKVMGGMHQLVAEKSVLGGVTHAEIGAWICQRWNFNPELIRVVQYHHTPYLKSQDDRTLEIMYLADLIGTEYYERLLNLNINVQINHKVLNSLNLSLEDQQQIGSQLTSRVELLAKRFIL